MIEITDSLRDRAESVAVEGEQLAKKLTELMDGYSIPTVGVGFGLAASMLIARAEMDGKGAMTMDLLQASIKALGETYIKKMQHLKADPEKYREFLKSLGIEDVPPISS